MVEVRTVYGIAAGSGSGSGSPAAESAADGLVMKMTEGREIAEANDCQNCEGR